jgi:hypothetical protein
VVKVEATEGLNIAGKNVGISLGATWPPFQLGVKAGTDDIKIGLGPFNLGVKISEAI